MRKMGAAFPGVRPTAAGKSGTGCLACAEICPRRGAEPRAARGARKKIPTAGLKLQLNRADGPALISPKWDAHS